MAAKKKPRPKLTSGPPTIHEATLASGPSGVVIKGAESAFSTAVTRRQDGLNIVVCGENLRVTRSLAQAIEAAVGLPTEPQEPHRRAGPHALPHFHQDSRSPVGHSFYETASPQQKARKGP